MLARRFCVFNVGLKVDAAREISTMIMMSNDENVHSRKRQFDSTFIELPVMGDKTGFHRLSHI